MNKRVKVRKADIRDILEASFPDYRGRKFFVEFTTTINIHNLNWSGGSRNQYVAVNNEPPTVPGEPRDRMEFWRNRAVQLSPEAPWTEVREGAKIELPVNAMVVKHTDYCGSDLGITIYAHPDNAPKWLASG
jgi:hypothetical protein